MDEHAISVREVSKSYTLHHDTQPKYQSLREVLVDKTQYLARRVLARDRPYAKSASKETFWALRDVSFDVERGDRLGIIGRNGAGKSTLLKILSRITEPTKGKVKLRGRVSSLLEVGTGFHPELTGRENIFLNGTILGMTSREIRRKFDDIVAFAEIEQFLDTPVKRYSSGMYVRLAFSVAAHLEPDILIVDEVLAVGDLQFQRRCLGRMGELSGAGRTVLFVTHNMDALVSLCNKGIVLDHGSISFSGTAGEARARYIEAMGRQKFSVDEHSGRGGSGGASIKDVWLEDGKGERVTNVSSHSSLSLFLSAEVSDTYLNRTDVDFAFAVDTDRGQRLWTVVSSWTETVIVIQDRFVVVACDVNELPLVPGHYLVSASIVFRGDTLDAIQHCASFEVLPSLGADYARNLGDAGSLNLKCSFRRLTNNSSLAGKAKN